MTTGQKLLRARDSLGLTQAEVAQLAGIDPHHYWKLEADRHAPEVATLQRLGTALRVPWHELAGD